MRVKAGLYSRQYLESQLAVALGGRLAEEIIFGEDNTTTGATNDFQQVAKSCKHQFFVFRVSSKWPEVVLIYLLFHIISKELPTVVKNKFI